MLKRNMKNEGGSPEKSEVESGKAAEVPETQPPGRLLHKVAHNLF